MERPLLPVRARDTWYAIDAPLVLEVLGKRRWIPIPGAPARSPGVIGWQGRAIALVELGVLNEPSPTGGVERERIVVVRVGPATLALGADVVREVYAAQEERLRPLHLTRGLKFATAEVDVEGRIMPVLDLAELVRDITRDTD